MGAAFGCCAVQQTQRWLYLTCRSLLRALVLVCSMNWKRHMTNWRQGERDGEGGRGREERRRERVCVGNHMVSHTSEPVSTQKVQAPSTPQQLLLLQSRDAVQHTTTQQQQSHPTGGSAATRARRGLGLICICCCSWWWWWWWWCVGHGSLRCSTKQCEVDPCSRCATRTSWKKGCVHGSV